MYILECEDHSYYTGSTIDLKRSLNQHKDGDGAKKKALIKQINDKLPELAKKYFKR